MNMLCAGTEAKTSTRTMACFGHTPSFRRHCNIEYDEIIENAQLPLEKSEWIERAIVIIIVVASHKDTKNRRKEKATTIVIIGDMQSGRLKWSYHFKVVNLSHGYFRSFGSLVHGDLTHNFPAKFWRKHFFFHENCISTFSHAYAKTVSLFLNSFVAVLLL